MRVLGSSRSSSPISALERRVREQGSWYAVPELLLCSGPAVEAALSEALKDPSGVG